MLNRILTRFLQRFFFSLYFSRARKNLCYQGTLSSPGSGVDKTRTPPFRPRTWTLFWTPNLDPILDPEPGPYSGPRTWTLFWTPFWTRNFFWRKKNIIKLGAYSENCSSYIFSAEKTLETEISEISRVL